ncbi:hypothetical protein HYH03_011615 [Edaphochlamys debaryana]|uniref:Protein kinase domain-containing protein n=1 Tax=Edaphochlamys debaryana TaxID=47281 RepID=A0A836BUW0_9CHLO|nr:hypothetical protein HYH03_011615 [Edaphochlamys debaryana]|eukprot:KAG2489986.1 hypothetical protein HYH03_011615 [Edaphochlamys debaryana]
MMMDSMARGRSVYTDEQAVSWLLDAAEALHFLHTSRPACIHRDVKAENVLLKREGSRTVAKLGDLGLHVTLEQSRPVMLRARRGAISNDGGSISGTFISIAPQDMDLHSLGVELADVDGAAAALGREADGAAFDMARASLTRPLSLGTVPSSSGGCGRPASATRAGQGSSGGGGAGEELRGEALSSVLYSSATDRDLGLSAFGAAPAPAPAPLAVRYVDGAGAPQPGAEHGGGVGPAASSSSGGRPCQASSTEPHGQACMSDSRLPCPGRTSANAPPPLLSVRGQSIGTTSGRAIETPAAPSDADADASGAAVPGAARSPPGDVGDAGCDDSGDGVGACRAADSSGSCPAEQLASPFSLATARAPSSASDAAAAATLAPRKTTALIFNPLRRASSAASACSTRPDKSVGPGSLLPDILESEASASVASGPSGSPRSSISGLAPRHLYPAPNSRRSGELEVVEEQPPAPVECVLRAAATQMPEHASTDPGERARVLEAYTGAGKGSVTAAGACTAAAAVRAAAAGAGRVLAWAKGPAGAAASGPEAQGRPARVERPGTPEERQASAVPKVIRFVDSATSRVYDKTDSDLTAGGSGTCGSSGSCSGGDTAARRAAVGAAASGLMVSTSLDTSLSGTRTSTGALRIPTSQLSPAGPGARPGVAPVATTLTSAPHAAAAAAPPVLSSTSPHAADAKLSTNTTGTLPEGSSQTQTPVCSAFASATDDTVRATASCGAQGLRRQSFLADALSSRSGTPPPVVVLLPAPPGARNSSASGMVPTGRTASSASFGLIHPDALLQLFGSVAPPSVTGGASACASGSGHRCVSPGLDAEPPSVGSSAPANAHVVGQGASFTTLSAPGGAGAVIRGAHSSADGGGYRVCSQRPPPPPSPMQQQPQSQPQPQPRRPGQASAGSSTQLRSSYPGSACRALAAHAAAHGAPYGALYGSSAPHCTAPVVTALHVRYRSSASSVASMRAGSYVPLSATAVSEEPNVAGPTAGTGLAVQQSGSDQPSPAKARSELASGQRTAAVQGPGAGATAAATLLASPQKEKGRGGGGEREDSAALLASFAGVRRLGSITSLLRPASGVLPELEAFQWVYGLTGQAGSCMYMAPEVYARTPYNAKCDVFSFGVLLYELLAGELLLAAYFVGGARGLAPRGPMQAMKVPLDYARRVSEGYRPPRHPRLSDEQWSLVTSCWDQDPCERPNMAEVVEALRGMLRRHQESQQELRQVLLANTASAGTTGTRSSSEGGSKKHKAGRSKAKDSTLDLGPQPLCGCVIC